MLPPGALLVSEGHTTVGPFQSRWSVLTPGTMVISRPRPLSKTMSGSVVFPQSGSVLMSVAHVATKDHMDAWGLDHTHAHEGI